MKPLIPVTREMEANFLVREILCLANSIGYSHVREVREQSALKADFGVAAALDQTRFVRGANFARRRILLSFTMSMSPESRSFVARSIRQGRMNARRNGTR